MVGQGVLRECLRDPGVTQVVAVGRDATRQQHSKLREIVRKDLFDLSSIERDLTGFDACFFCLGVSSAAVDEIMYRRITYDMTMSVAQTLIRLNPNMTFIYVSGAGTDSTETGRMMWARVKGKTENDLLTMTEKSYMFRPAFIQPMHGALSRSKVTRIFYKVVGPLYPLVKHFPRFVTTTETIGRAMLAIAKHGTKKRVLESRDINALAA